MNRAVQTLILSASIFCWALGAPVARAQDAEPSRWRPSVSVTPVYIGASDLDGGGEFESRGVAVRLGAMRAIGPGTRAGLTLAYSHSDNRFIGSTAFGAGAPWGDMERIGLSASVIHARADGWIFSFNPSADYFREEGAALGEALTFGGVVSASMGFAKGRVFGLGAGLFRQLDDVQAFVFPAVDWALTKRLRITNPLPAGPTGPAGLELTYQVSEKWVLGGGGAYRQLAFRLRDDGPFPDGIAEETGIIAFLHAGTRAGRRVSIDVYGGAVIAGQIEVKDRNGDDLISRDLGTAPIVGTTLKLAF